MVTKMKKTIAILCFMPLIAVAQTTTDSSATATTNSASTNAGNAQTIQFNAPPMNNYSVKTTGNAMMPGFSGSFSSDYCGATAAGGVGGMGFAFSFGAPYIDQSCLLLRTYERTMQNAAQQVDPDRAEIIRDAGLEILAEINPKVRAIYEKRGLIEVKEK